MKKCFNFRALAILGLVISFTGCANKMIDYEVENNWTNLLDRNNIDYHSFSDAAKSAIYGMRWDSDSDFVNLVEVSRESSDIQGASSMEVEAIAKAGVEDSFIIADVSMAYANASAISIAVDNYCEQCYKLGNVVKNGTYSFKISSRVSSGTVKYSGKSNDLKKYLNKFLHSEARNGYCHIIVNEYNKPISVFWSQTQFDKEQISNMSSFNLMDIEDIQNGSPVIGAYPGTFKLNNFSIYRTALNTSVSNKLTAPVCIEYDDVEDTIDDIATAFADDIFSAISESSEKMTPYELESRISTDNSNAKLAYTNAATYITKSEVNGYQVADGWYIADLNNNGNTTRDCKYDGTDIDKALTELMGSESAGYVCVHIKNSMIDKSYYCRENIFIDLSLDSLPEILECNEDCIIGAYPYESVISDNPNF